MSRRNSSRGTDSIGIVDVRERTFLLVFVHADVVPADASFVLGFEIEEATSDVRRVLETHALLGLAIETDVVGEAVDDRARAEVEPVDLSQPEANDAIDEASSDGIGKPFGKVSDDRVDAIFHVLNEQLVGAHLRLVPDLHEIPHE